VFVASDDGVNQRMTVANTVAKPLDDACQVWTTLEHRPWAPTPLGDPGRLAQNYGSEGWGFESLRARPAQRPSRPSAAAFLLTDLLTAGSSPAGIKSAPLRGAGSGAPRAGLWPWGGPARRARAVPALPVALIW